MNDLKYYLLRYQTHQLRNVSDDFCATINCYKYDSEDSVQWNMFDYVNAEDGNMENFVPNADLTFKQMEKIVMEEWNKSKFRSTAVYMGDNGISGTRPQIITSSYQKSM